MFVQDVTQHLHQTMLNAMQQGSKELYLPRSARNRSQSLSEAQRTHNAVTTLEHI